MPDLQHRVYYAIAVITGLTLVVAVLTLQPLPSYRPRADFSRPAVVALTPFISNCHFQFLDCQDHPQKIAPSAQINAAIASALNALGSTYDLNPRLIAALYLLANPQLQDLNQVNQTSLMDFTRTLNRTALEYQNQTPPLVIDHPIHGAFKLKDFNSASHILVRYVLAAVSDPNQALAILTPSSGYDGQIRGFSEVYYQLFLTDPLQP